jgi:hypothetical protein
MEAANRKTLCRASQTRREHFIELLNEDGWRSFGLHEYRDTTSLADDSVKKRRSRDGARCAVIGELRHRHIHHGYLQTANR